MAWLNLFSVKFKSTDGESYALKFVDGKPRFSTMPYLYDIAEGNVTGHTSFDKYAVNDDVDSAAEEDIWCVGGTYSWLAAESALVAVSSSAEDDNDKGAGVPGTGIKRLRVYYLDSSFVERTTDVTMNGVGEVGLSVANVYRINRLRPITVGTGLKAVGNVDVKVSGGAVISRMAAGYTKGRQLVYTVPAGKTLYIAQMSGSIGRAANLGYGKFTLRSTYDNITGNRNAWMTPYAEHGCESSSFTKDFPCPMVFPAGSDIIMSCKTLDNDCYITGAIRGWLETA